MTQENLEKHHAYLIWLASGDFNERDFDYKIKANDNPNGKKGEGGWSTMGDMSSARRQLIMQDAKRTLAIFERKYPEFISKPEVAKVKPETAAQKKARETKEAKAAEAA